MPGLTTKIRVTPDRVGRYEVVCAELCGLGHSTMRQYVRVVPGGRVRSWVADRSRPRAAAPRAAAAAAAAGRRRRRRAALHLQRLLGLPHAGGGRRHRQGRARTSASSATPSAAFIHTSIVDPNAEVTKGYKPNIMPQDFEDKLSKEELDALVKYLLKAQE